MPRKPRSALEGRVHHIWSRAVPGLRLFHGEIERRFFLRRLNEACLEKGVRIYDWVLPDTHYHLLVPGPLQAISEVLAIVGTIFAQHIQHRDGRHGAVFGARFGSKPVASDDHLAELHGYLPMNLVTVGIVKSLESLRTSLRSGLGALLGVRDRQLSCHDVDGALALAGPTPELARHNLSAILSNQYGEWQEARRLRSPRAFLLLACAERGVFIEDVFRGDRSRRAVDARRAATVRCILETSLRDGEIAQALGVARRYVARMRLGLRRAAFASRRPNAPT